MEGISSGNHGGRPAQIFDYNSNYIEVYRVICAFGGMGVFGKPCSNGEFRFLGTSPSVGRAIGISEQISTILRSISSSMQFIEIGWHI